MTVREEARPGGAGETVFDVCGPLPEGTTVLEASAGTGKTFTIAALAARYVAQAGVDLADLLVVTFGRAATSELRDRVRERLVHTERALRGPGAGTHPDAVVRYLADADEAEVGRRRRRLVRALAQFDAATITTTHGFCQQTLAALGIAADADPVATFVPDVADLVDEVVDDLYLQRYADDPAPPLSPAEARDLARAAVSDHQARLEPAAADPASLPGHRHALAAAARREVRRRKRRQHLIDYDDLLVLLRDALTDPSGGPEAAARVRSRYRVVLVDEFQDTDPVQWEILRTAFHGHRTMVLIGDPKQAIYAFRGGDVVAYLDARAEATSTATLGRNWRSDHELLAGLGTILRGAALGDERIVAGSVDAEHTGRRLEGGPPVRIRRVTREPFRLGGAKNPRIGAVRELVAADVADDVVRQLGVLRLREAHGMRALEPGDVAVLTRRNADAVAVREALAACGVPAVVSGLTSVFGTRAAQDWLTLLTALEQPGHPGRTAALALTPFVGWDARHLAGASDAERDELSDRVRQWGRTLAERGVAALLESVTAAGAAERLMRLRTGERALTDLRHVGQSLHVAAVRDRLGVAALTDWLRRRIAEAGQDYAEERSRRLETDAAAVQVVTIHASKGLEFPVVYVPFAWDRFEARTPRILRYHDGGAPGAGAEDRAGEAGDGDGQRVLHVGGPEDQGYGDARERHLAAERGEDLRLLYVALTRASHQVIVHWAPSSNTAGGPLTRLLLGDVVPGRVPQDKVRSMPDDAVTRALTERCAAGGGTVELETVRAGSAPVRWEPPRRAGADLAVARWGRALDLAWRRTSYTGLTAAAHDAGGGVASEPEAPGVQDEPDDGAQGVPGRVPPGEPGADLPSPMADLPAGAAFGTLVHDVLEHLDTSAPDLQGELLARCREAPPLPGATPEALAAALEPVLATPLGPLADGATLAGIAPADRLAELEFELPLAGGDRPEEGRRPPTVGDVTALLRRHLAADDRFAAYPGHLERLAGDGAATLRGYLTGSIDAVLRIGAGRTTRYLVVDYKTNRLGPPEEPLTAWHYRPEAMAEAMMAAHYPLQLLLYSAALHRYLRWRQRDYDPARHLGGALYLFVRGMCGPATPQARGVPHGIMSWRPPAALVTALSDLLDGRRP